MIVAIGVTLVLIFASGRIFTTSRTTISTGTAIAEIGQYTRTLERMIRDDFQSLTRDGFLVIRNERLGIGDPTQRGVNRRPVYLNAEMKEEDDANSSELITMGVRRLDQIVFYATGEFPTYQYREGGALQTNARNDTAPIARIWYGHGLRDPDPYDAIDGIKKASGVGFDPDNTYHADSRGTDTANYYAQEWILGRQAALLLRREMVGNDWQLHFAPSFIDVFNEQEEYWRNEDYFAHYPNNAHNVTYRLSPGYTDIIDMSLVEVEKAVSEYGLAMNEDRDINNPQYGTYDAWEDPIGGQWFNDMWTPDPLAGYVTDQEYIEQLGEDGTSIAEEWVIQQRLRMMFSTGRIRMESVPQYNSSEWTGDRLEPTDRMAQMQTHATAIVGCSNFEIAWSTGEVTYPEGDLVWYDIDNPANPYLPHPGLDARQVYEQTPSDPKLWYLSEMAGTYDEYDMRDLPRGGPLEEPAREDLYYATFGYFVPRERDEHREEVWPWPSMIRFRVTLHDHSGRLTGGRAFEYIVRLPAQR